MLEVQPKDSRDYFMLPQAPQDAGYYVYGRLDGMPSHGAYQYAHPSMMTAILRVEGEWLAIDKRKFGVGGIKAPTVTDRKLAIAIEGQPAKEIFDSIGPDRRPTCSQDKGDRDRRKGGVQCTYSPEGNGKDYRCWIGINLRTGESIPTVSC
jgi:hypothetical protein